MQHLIDHILLENYPNPPPPGFPYPPLPHIIQVNDNKLNKEYNFTDHHHVDESILNDNSLSDVDLREKNYEPTAYVISIHEPSESAIEILEYEGAKEVSQKFVMEMIEEIEIGFYESNAQKIIEITELMSTNEYEVKEIEKANEKIEEIKETNSSNNNIFEPEINIIVHSEVEENPRSETKCDQIIVHNFLEYPNPAPVGFVHTSVPNIVSYNSINYIEEENEVSTSKYEQNNNRSNEEKTVKDNGIDLNDENAANSVEVSSSDETSTIEQDIKSLHEEIEKHTLPGPILHKNVITAQPKNDEDLPKRYLQKTDYPLQNVENSEKRIKTTICCCIKC